MSVNPQWKFVLRLLAYRSEGVFAHAGVGLAGGIAVCLANMVLPRMLPVIQPDSHTYLEFTAFRTSFYPLFLRLLHDGGDDLQTILTAQVIIHALAFAVLLFGVARARLPISALALFVLATAFNPFLQSFHHTILTESLAFSLTFLACGAFCLFVCERRTAFLALMTIFASMNVAVKLSALPLLIGLVMASGYAAGASTVTNGLVGFVMWYRSCWLPLVRTGCSLMCMKAGKASLNVICLEKLH